MLEINRIVDSIRRIIRSEFNDYTYCGVYEYSIQSVSGNFVDADPTDTTLSLPSIAHIELKSGLMGETVEPTVGKLCLIAFVNRSPSRPVVIAVAGDDKTIAFNAIESISIGGPGPRAARFGDTILAGGMFAGTITSGSTKTTIW